jgi:PAS domain S-box-containing protein
VLIALDGTETPIDDSAAPIRNHRGDIVGAVLVFRDIAERRASERAAAFLEALVASSDDAIFGKSLDGIVQTWNDGAERLYGYRAEEIIGHLALELIPPDRAHEESDVLERLRAGERVSHMETVRRRKDGTLRDVSLTLSPVLSPTGEVVGVSHVARDITEQKRHDQNLHQTQKLESLGVLAGGIAHDFNNLLVGMLGNASLALEELPSHTPARALIQDVILASERAAQLTRQMLAYSGKGRFVLEKIDLSAEVRETLPLLQAAIPRTVELRLQLARELPLVEVDPSQLHQVVMNLVVNGAEAIPEGRTGTVDVTTKRVRVDAADLARRQDLAGGELRAGEYVLLEIRDSGAGMDAATRERIFDPFFTTKFTGRGLGLAAVLGIVRGHGGSIAVSSEPGRGATFRVWLPAKLQAEKRVQPDGQPPRDLTGAGTVLVVDDDDTVRRVAKTALERHGYTVLAAVNGAEGVELFRRHADEIRCVILDLTMPVMSGEEALRQIAAARSGVPVILSSGYSEAEALRRFAGQGLAGFLQKPYQAATLAAKVREALGVAGAAG